MRILSEHDFPLDPDVDLSKSEKHKYWLRLISGKGFGIVNSEAAPVCGNCLCVTRFFGSKRNIAKCPKCNVAERLWIAES